MDTANSHPIPYSDCYLTVTAILRVKMIMRVGHLFVLIIIMISYLANHSRTTPTNLRLYPSIKHCVHLTCIHNFACQKKIAWEYSSLVWTGDWSMNLLHDFQSNQADVLLLLDVMPKSNQLNVTKYIFLVFSLLSVACFLSSEKRSIISRCFEIGTTYVSDLVSYNKRQDFELIFILAYVPCFCCRQILISCNCVELLSSLKWNELSVTQNRYSYLSPWSFRNGYLVLPDKAV